jgi:hypothetical protein
MAFFRFIYSVRRHDWRILNNLIGNIVKLFHQFELVVRVVGFLFLGSNGRLELRNLFRYQFGHRLAGLELRLFHEGVQNTRAHLVITHHGAIEWTQIKFAGPHVNGLGICHVQEIHDLVGSAVQHGQMEWQHALVIAASDACRTNLHETTNDAVRGIQNNGQMEWQNRPLGLAGVLAIIASDPSSSLFQGRKSIGKEVAGPVCEIELSMQLVR